MSESIEKTILRILNQVSAAEITTNRALPEKTLRVLKALAYLKAANANKLGA